MRKKIVISFFVLIIGFLISYNFTYNDKIGSNDVTLNNIKLLQAAASESGTGCVLGCRDTYDYHDYCFKCDCHGYFFKEPWGDYSFCNF